MMERGKPLRYDGRPNPEIQRLRQIDASITEERVDWFAAQEAILSRPIKVDFPIPAIRGWHLNSTGCYLISLAAPYQWDSPVEREHTNVTRKGYTGFWAVKPNKKGISIVRPYRPTIVGIVELSGRVIEHEYGWRGEVCTIVELFTDEDIAHSFGNILEETYQCDLKYGTLETAIRRLKQG